MIDPDDELRDKLTEPPRGPEQLQEYKRLLGLRNINELLVMDRTKDPFNAGGAADHHHSAWFSRTITGEFGDTRDIHNRRVHYRIFTKQLRGADGQTYENTNTHWGRLCSAFSKARDLGYVDPLRFVDRRNDAPIVNAPTREQPAEPEFVIDEPYWRLPRIESTLDWTRFTLPRPEVYGYDYAVADQPYLVEVWIEKTTMDDVLDPLCRQLGVNLVRGAGFESKTAVINLLQRAQAHGGRTRVFYVSDFDPAGNAMYFAVARACQYYLPQYAPGIDFALTPIALTADQIRHYNLPRTPIKEEDKRRAKFESVHGAGCVELDALEGLYPGELARIVTEAIAPYRDDELADALEATDRAAQRSADQQFDQQFADLQDRLDQLAESVRLAAQPYADQIDELTQRLETDLDPYREQLEALHREALSRISTLRLSLPARPEPTLPAPDEDTLLFHSERHWIDQLNRFHAARNNPTGN